MAQIISIKMSKFDNQPWGFRLQGGTDFAAPLTVLRVHGDSLAEKAGLRVGDALIRVNDTDIYQLRHKEAQDVIVRAGNNFELVISRGGGMPKTVVRPNDIQVVGPTVAPAPAPAPAPTPVATVEQKADGGNVKLVNRQFNSPMPLYSEENIAETLSSQAEVLAQGVLGVNFKKNEKTFNPANSEVFKMVQDMDRAPREPEPGIDIDPADASPAQKGLASRTIQSRTFQRIQQQTNNQSLDAASHHQHQPQHQQQITISTKPILSPTSVQQGPPTPAERAPHFAPLAAPHLKPQSPGAFPGKTFLGHHPMTAPMPAAVPPPPGGVRIFPPAPVAKSISQVGHQVKMVEEVRTMHESSSMMMATVTSSSSVSSEMMQQQMQQMSCSSSTMAASSSSFVSEESTVVSSSASFADHHQPAPLASAPVKPVSFAPAAPRPAAPSPDGSTKVTWPPASEQAEEALAPPASLSAPEEPAPVVEPPATLDVPQPVSVVEPSAPIVAEPAPAPAPAPSPTPVATPAPTVVPVSSVIGYHDEMSQHQQTSANAGFLTGIPAASATPPAGGKGNGGATNSGPRRGKGIMNHHVAGTRIPVCATCNAQIRGKFVTALGLTWCPEHFLCSMEQCRHELHDTGFVEEQGKLYCETCFENYLAPTCARCSKRVKAECLNAIGKQFHPECFACTYCGRLFGNSHFYLEDGLPYCEADWNELFTTKCFACGFPIEAGDRWVEAMNNNYHSQCFNCSVCKKNLEGQSFLGKGGRPMCKSHVR